MTAQRLLFLIVAILIGTGIYLSGFKQVHWFSYLPAVLLLFAGLTGICPTLLVLKKLGFK